ncbi:hypothetical protein EES37_37880 [Streptomyces sp. ADI91-18]|uniref:hypothetical protein n=1 Tax=Streptomyces sp. ADI91-18 TaxID=1522755 RepID=UPI000FB9C5A3|nr:hypothetical protein [Streptomyces sp. ADI91-18]RPK23529.1 hypothetical protein EES37_37880 [Streptomyces sp. ADI91-18]
MGKASRGKKQRNRDSAGTWSAAKAARTAHQARADTRKLLLDNVWVHAMLASNMNNRMAELNAVLGHSDGPEQHRENLAFAMMIGKQGWKPPWPPGPAQAARWQTQQVLHLLDQAEVLVISPAAHAAVMAAASTLEPADVATLDKDRDILIPTGVLVLPEPVIVENRGGSLSDIRAFGWQPVTQHQVLPDAQYPGIQLTCFMDRDGPVQPESWRMAVAQARATGSPLPPLVPDGIYGLRADGALSTASSEQHASLSEEHRSLNTALNQVAEYNAVPPEEGQWDGGRILDAYDDFAARYAFAFWRLAAQGITALGSPVEPGTPAYEARPGETRPDPDVRVIRLAHQIPAQRSAGDEGSSRAYHHRWTVRMHKVRQWYPSTQEHRLIWRGPYIKGPADAPFMIGEKAYAVD